MALNLPADINTQQDFVPILAAANAGKLGGVRLVFPTLAALNAAITKERANIAMGANLAIWAPGTIIDVAGEPGHRVWTQNTGTPANSHARTFQFPNGKQLTLAADGNTVQRTTGAPSGAGTTSGDRRIDLETGLLYTWTASWDAGVQYLSAVSPVGSSPTAPVQVTESRALTSADHGKVLECTATATLNVPASLPTGFKCVVIPFGTTSVSFTGTTGNGANTTIARSAANNAMFGIVQRGSSATSYVVDGV